MAEGFTKDGAVQDQIDASLADEVNTVRMRGLLQLIPETTEQPVDLDDPTQSQQPQWLAAPGLASTRQGCGVYW